MTFAIFRKSAVLCAGILSLALMTSCLTTTVKDDPDAIPERYNMRFIGYDTGIENPSMDRRSYYKVYIDKVEAGRTTTGLESQKKTFEAKLSPNRHLITIEKWVLNPKKGAYEKVNNISQPKPNYCYFDTGGSAPVIIRMEISSDNRAQFIFEGSGN